MKKSARFRVAASAIVAGAVFLGVAWKSEPMAAQILDGASGQQSVPFPSQPGTPIGPGDSADPVRDARMQQERVDAVNRDRHKRMQTDADRLLELATELKADVDRSTKNETSVAAYQKANEIERLAHDVKERLKN